MSEVKEGSFDGRLPKNPHPMDSYIRGKDKRINVLELKKQARHDALTGLPMIETFHEDLQKILAGGESFVLMVGDVNELKLHNDGLGHEDGDNLIVAVANFLRSNITHSTDKVYRPHKGGDEFYVLMRGMPETVVDKRVHEIMEKGNRDITLDPLRAPSISLGYVYVDKETPNDVRQNPLSYADRAMYQAKDEAKRIAQSSQRFKKRISVEDRLKEIRKIRDEGGDLKPFFGKISCVAKRFIPDQTNLPSIAPNQGM